MLFLRTEGVQSVSRQRGIVMGRFADACPWQRPGPRSVQGSAGSHLCTAGSRPGANRLASAEVGAGHAIACVAVLSLCGGCMVDLPPPLGSGSGGASGSSSSGNGGVVEACAPV